MATQNAINNFDQGTEGTFTPTVTLVGGAGNTVPVYTNNIGRYWRPKGDSRVFVEVNLEGDGGAEGAGTGGIEIALPFTASGAAYTRTIQCGRATEAATEYFLVGFIVPSATTIALAYINALTTSTLLTGNHQANTDRTIRLSFWYEV